MTLFAHNLASDGSIGVKLVNAKTLYFASIASYDPYAEKALAEATFYGLPFYRIGNGADPSLAGTITPQGTGAVQTYTPNLLYTLARNDTERGTYWQATEATTPSAD